MKIAAIVFLVLLLDQTLKIWVKTNMYYGEEIKILGLDWALIHFVENNGMAFGISLGGEYGKLFLSLFRIVAVGFLVYYINVLLKSKAAFGLLLSFALILAGALGNILDSAFYGLIFSESPYHSREIAQLFPAAGGYSSFLHGKVVDMLYFPLVNTYFPDWVPFVGGNRLEFFKPVFNLADTSITVGVLNILLFQRHFFSGHHEEQTPEQENVETIAGEQVWSGTENGVEPTLESTSEGGAEENTEPDEQQKREQPE